MGNCMLRLHSPSSLLDHHQAVHHDDREMMIKVVTTSGAIMELYAPITAAQITAEFHGHALFRSLDHAPLLPKDTLLPGHLYYLLPLSAAKTTATSEAAVPYRISVDDPRLEVKGSDPARFKGNKGVWKVRLVINPEQLSEILSQDSRTEELIESVRAVAKCGAATSMTSTVAAEAEAGSKCSSDESSVSSSCNFHWKSYVKQTSQSKCSIVDSSTSKV